MIFILQTIKDCVCVYNKSSKFIQSTKDSWSASRVADAMHLEGLMRYAFSFNRAGTWESRAARIQETASLVNSWAVVAGIPPHSPASSSRATWILITASLTLCLANMEFLCTRTSSHHNYDGNGKYENPHIALWLHHICHSLVNSNVYNSLFWFFIGSLFINFNKVNAKYIYFTFLCRLPWI